MFTKCSRTPSFLIIHPEHSDIQTPISFSICWLLVWVAWLHDGIFIYNYLGLAVEVSFSNGYHAFSYRLIPSTWLSTWNSDMLYSWVSSRLFMFWLVIYSCLAGPPLSLTSILNVVSCPLRALSNLVIVSSLIVSFSYVSYNLSSAPCSLLLSLSTFFVNLSISVVARRTGSSTALAAWLPWSSGCLFSATIRLALVVINYRSSSFYILQYVLFS